MKKMMAILFLVWGSLLLVGFSHMDQTEYDKMGNMILPAEAVVDHTTFYAGNEILIEGTIKGTTFASGQKIVVDGLVQGDLFAAGQDIEINGLVEGNIFMAGQNIDYLGNCQGDVFAAGQNLIFDKESYAERDVMLAGESVTVVGSIGRHLDIAAEKIVLSGEVNGDVFMEVNDLQVQDTALIRGNMIYNSYEPGIFGSEVMILGEKIWQEKIEDIVEPNLFDFRPFKIVFSFFSGLMLWLIILLWRPQLWENMAAKTLRIPLKTLAFGALALLMTPLIAVAFMVTIIGIPVGIILLFSYVTVIYLSKLMTAVVLGQWIRKMFGWKEIHKNFWYVILGLLVVTGVTMIPVVGVLIRIAIVLWGLGIVTLWLGPHSKA